ncbi:phage protein Gp27 family protein [Ruminococcus callidus]|uniref:phage protein Gp27 family protein n=1 Tax=Ruminococcus callidus TaxID=40519 RepID=UPI0023F75B8E|nr:phage protein Gp27 family protein [Ruminococcus callidus]
MGRRKHSKIDNLEPAVKETVDEMIKTGAYYREIVDYIQSHGVSISLAAVGKYAKNLMSTLDALRLSQENFRAIMEETDRYPDLDMTDGILRLLCNQMLDAINKLPEERLSEIDFDTLSNNAVALTRAVAYKKNVDTKTRDLLENGAEQFKDLIYEAMAAERPDLYKEVKKFIKSKAKEGKA